ncbi:MAG TPA: hypothetical protein VFL54_11610 [Gammaproteobacteria bacterium]|jgi:hypothetical protein|nr:hypothetical protein [Gammaproteobacteria bacterium]
MAVWLALAAAPAFALMALLTAIDASGMGGSGFLPIDTMTAMYLLMSLFHLPSWLRFIGRGRQA